MLLGDRATGRPSHLGRRSTRRAKACSSRSTTLVPKMTPVAPAALSLVRVAPAALSLVRRVRRASRRAGDRHLFGRAGVDQRVVAVGKVGEPGPRTVRAGVVRCSVRLWCSRIRPEFSLSNNGVALGDPTVHTPHGGCAVAVRAPRGPLASTSSAFIRRDHPAPPPSARMAVE
jgi:hypothetical protein